jgi:hypothetical protein
MFNTECVQQWSLASGPAPSAASLLARVASAGIDETSIMFAGATIGLAASTVIVLRALSQAF